MSLYARAKSIYRAALPEPLRRWGHAHAPDFVLALRYRVVSRLEKGAVTDDLYDGHYFDNDVGPLMLSSADAIAASLTGEFEPTSAIDVGCGTGALIASLERLGVRSLGFDHATAALERCRRRGVTARRLDIEQDPFPAVRADLAISTEVAEHLPESSADRFVELLTTLAPAVVVTAALPGSRGKDHVNEQPNEYWIEKFAARSFNYEREMAIRLRHEWEDGGVAETFHRSLMVFKAQRASDS